MVDVSLIPADFPPRLPCGHGQTMLQGNRCIACENESLRARAERLQGALEEIAGFEDGNRGFDEMGYREAARAALDQEEPKGGEAVGCLGSDSRQQALATRPPLSLDQEEAEGVDPGLVDPEEAAKHLTESERQAYRDSQQSIVNASRGTGLRESAESS